MKPKNNGKDWTEANVNQLERLAKQNVDTDIIAEKLGRTKNAIYKQASKEDISLKPKDK